MLYNSAVFSSIVAHTDASQCHQISYYVKHPYPTLSHIFQNASILEKLADELDMKLPDTVEVAYPVDRVEENLPHSMGCIQENFHLNGVVL